jgi:hypothetical protein
VISAEEALSSWHPKNAYDTCVNFEIEIGFRGEEKSYLFSITFITLKALTKIVKKECFIFGAGYFISESYDFRVFKDWLDKIVHSCIAHTWEEAANYFNHYFLWEWHNCKC